MRKLSIIVLSLPLLTGGCFVGDGVAHVVKLANKNYSSDAPGASAPVSVAQPAPAPAASAAPIDRDPAPMPATAPVADIKVEDLPPPRQ